MLFLDQSPGPSRSQERWKPLVAHSPRAGTECDVCANLEIWNAQKVWQTYILCLQVGIMALYAVPIRIDLASRDGTWLTGYLLLHWDNTALISFWSFARLPPHQFRASPGCIINPLLPPGHSLACSCSRVGGEAASLSALAQYFCAICAKPIP